MSCCGCCCCCCCDRPNEEVGTYEGEVERNFYSKASDIVHQGEMNYRKASDGYQLIDHMLEEHDVDNIEITYNYPSDRSEPVTLFCPICGEQV